MATVDYDSNADRVEARILGGTFAGMLVAGEFLLGESRAQVPIDESILEQSGAVVSDRAEMEVAVTYDTPYAVRQHEELDYRHAPGRKAKYLEDPAGEHADTIRQIVATHARRATRG